LNITIWKSADTRAETILQTVVFDGSCSQSLSLGDQFGASQLLTFVNELQGQQSSILDATITITMSNNKYLDTFLGNLQVKTKDKILDFSEDVSDLILQYEQSIPHIYSYNIDLSVVRNNTIRTSVNACSVLGYPCSDTHLLHFMTGEISYLSPFPSVAPSYLPSFQPSISTTPSENPSFLPSFQPSISTTPSENPSYLPSFKPSISIAPSEKPSYLPTFQPSISVTPSKATACNPITPTGCSVCGDNKFVSNSDAIFAFPGQPTVPCGLLETSGLNGLIPLDQCPFLPTLISDTCGCKECK